MSAVLSGSFSGSLSGSGQTVTVSTPLLNLTQTWNAGGVTFTGALVNVTDTASAAGSLLLDLQVAGSSKFSVAKSGALTVNGVTSTSGGMQVPSSSFFQWANGTSIFSTGSGVIQLQTNGNTANISLAVDAANTLALRNGVSAQTFNLYGTFTDSSNYERVAFTASSVMAITSVSAGTGVSRALQIGTQGTSNVDFFTGNNTRWSIGGSSGNLISAAAANAIVLKQGANGMCGTFVANGASAVTVNNTSVAITDTIHFSLNTVGGTVGAYPTIKTITAATGFTVAATAADTSTYNYVIIKNAP